MMRSLLSVVVLIAMMGCDTTEDNKRLLEFQVDGTVSQAAITWQIDSNTQFDLAAELPWIKTLEAPEGASVFLSVSSGNLDAGLWIRVLEDGQEVLVVPGCLCNGSTVSAQATGTVGDWNW
jgi:hypothetical protein